MNQTFIYLASASPRRRILLEQMGVAYRVHAVDIDESRRSGEDAEALVSRLAESKAEAALAAVPEPRPVLAADTVVVADHHVLGKPRDREHGIEMLMRLAGRSHRVLTAVSLRHGSVRLCRTNVTEVTFSALTPGECAAYWDTGEPCDKAGGYAVQGRAAVFISELRGSYSGVMGLPLFETAAMLREVGLNPLQPASETAT